MFEEILSATIRGATPLLLAALGEVISQRAGVLNIGIEGMMLIGAFFGMVGSFYTEKLAMIYMPELAMIAPWFGLLMAGISGLIAAALFALCAIRLRGDQVIIGTAMTLLALGLTEVVYQRLFGATGIAQGVPAFQQIAVPLLSQIPFFGRALFSHNILVFLTFLLVPCVYFFLYHTQQGLRVRACGEHPRAIAAAGANVLRLRTVCLLFAGALAGMAGGYLSLADVPYFTPGMTVGRGFIALAIVIFGKWHPVKACGAALLFGLGSALDARFQALGWDVPYQVFLMLPYVLCLAVLAGFVGRAEAPLALGKPYRE
ncbi:ABC transporter permease [Candidatus Poribacteria bacterium]|nr:ABC transporter permease [Candidatus Poribacteria bacterium]